MQNKIDKLVIVQKKIKNREDSFWYRGLIATYGKYELYAVGDIRIQFTKDGTWFKNDQAVEEAEYKQYTDKHINKLFRKGYVDENNWFEVICPDGESVLGDVGYEYDEAINLLKAYYDEEV